MDSERIKPTQRDLATGNFHQNEIWERRVRIDGTNVFIDRDVNAALNLLFYSPETETRDTEGLKHLLKTSKPNWSDAGVLVEIETANRLTERELRRILRKGLTAVSVERLHPHSFLNGVCDAESKGIPVGSESLPHSETPSLQ